MGLLDRIRGGRPEKMACPRRFDIGGAGLDRYGDGTETPDHWRPDRTCSFCGALHPDDVMAHLTNGDWKISPATKSYKVYLRGPGTGVGKFYWAHLSVDQMRAFVDLYNERGRDLFERFTMDGQEHVFGFQPFPYFMVREGSGG